MPRVTALSVIFLTASMTGCSTVSYQECYRADWFERGRQAGAEGLPLSAVVRQQNDCAQVGVVPDRHGFAAGWRAGQQGT
jgi:hypothetical protein